MRQYRTFDDFKREEIRPLNRVGFSIDEFDIDESFAEEMLFDDDASADEDLLQ